MKQCIYCGESKDEEQFRPYYNRKSGRYSFCRSCEKIEARRKYLCRKSEFSDKDFEELNKINLLYKVRRANGLQAPGQSKLKPTVLSLVDSELNKLTKTQD